MVTLFATGRIGKVESQVTASGKSYTRFSVCTDLGTKDAQNNYESEWTNFTAWDKTAEIVAKYGAGDIVEVQATKKTTKKGDQYYTNYTVTRVTRLLKSKKTESAAAPTADDINDEEIPF